MTSTSSLAGKRVLVTGASRGIGAAIVRRLASWGAAVAVNYRSDRVAADAPVGELCDNGCAAAAFPADVGDAAQAHTASAAPRLVAGAQVGGRHRILDWRPVAAGGCSYWRGAAPHARLPLKTGDTDARRARK
jgi:NAD(P)-dependent dehydrogenase (short-subunit alcohol dehydrogenase family)